MIKSNIKQLNVEIKWQERLAPVSPFKWSVIWSNIHNSFSSTKAKNLQFKYLHNTIFTEDRLVYLNLSNGICKVCTQNRETLKHLFF